MPHPAARPRPAARRGSLAASAAALIAAALALGGCAAPATPAGPAAPEGDGSARILTAPEPAASPVAVPPSWAGDDDGLVPWLRDPIEAAGAPLPATLTELGGGDLDV